MKNLLFILLLIPFGILAQTPQGFKYQAVIRNANGSLVTNQQVAIKTSLISGSALGNVDYSEQHDVATNGYGVASFTVGNGTPITGSYAAVNWRGNDYFLKTELDIQNNGNFQLMGTSQILSVPYANHSKTATIALNDNDTSATNEIQQLSLQGNQLVLSDGGSVNLTTTVDLDPDPTNEIQALSLNNDTLLLSNGNYVVLANYLQSLSGTSGSISLSNSNTISLADSSATNEIQTLSSTPGSISLSSANTITLADSSSTNELQTLSQTAGTISLSNGNTITLMDSSSTNELQSLSVVGQDSLMITNGNTVKIPSLDNSETNEIQMLSNTAGTISISSGNTIVLQDSSSTNEIQILSNTAGTISISSGNTIVIEDSSSTNEIQNLSIIGDSLTISGGNSVKIPDEVPSGTIVFSESINDTELISRNYELIGAEIKNVALSYNTSSPIDTNYNLSWSNLTSINYSGNNYFTDNVYEINPISFVKNDKMYIVTNGNTTGNSQIVDLNNFNISSMNLGSYMQLVSFLWTGNDLYKFGGRTGSQWSTSMHNTLEKYDFSSNSWITLSSTNAPSPRCDASMLWTGDKLIVFGGMELYGYYTKAYKKSDGGIYDPVSDSWSSIPAPTSTGFAASNRHAIVWTGSEMIVWGGFTSTNSGNWFTSPQNKGARYNPATNTWFNLVDPPSSFFARGNSVHCWTGSKMLIFGGLYDANAFSYYLDGQLYDPSAGTWTSLPSNPTTVQGYCRSFISNSNELILGGFSNSNGNRAYNAVWKYNFNNNSWVNSPNNGVWDSSGEYWLDAPTSEIGPYPGVMSLCQKDSNSLYVVDMSGNIKYLSNNILIGKSLDMNNILQNTYYMYRKQ